MTPAEAAVALTVAAAYDGREVGETDAQAWAAALPEVTMEEARAAVVDYYRASRFRIMPADVLERVKRARRNRIASELVPAPPAELDDSPIRAMQWLGAFKDAVARGATPEEAEAHACQQLGVTPRPKQLGESARGRAAIEAAGKRTGRMPRRE